MSSTGGTDVQRCVSNHLSSASCVQQVRTNRMKHGSGFVSRPFPQNLLIDIFFRESNFLATLSKSQFPVSGPIKGALLLLIPVLSLRGGAF